LHNKENRRVTAMSMLFSRTPIIVVWLVVFTLFAWSRWPMPVALAMLMLIVGAAVPVMIFMLWKETPPTIAVVLHHVEESGKRRG
jgi:uncharacterized YccA/Bax inhibitor family protein